jgi:hypothetical protein
MTDRPSFRRALLGGCAALACALPVFSAEPGERERVALDEAAQKRLGIEVAPLEAARRTPTVESLARVLDPAPLAELDAAIARARAPFQAAKAEAERAESLFADDQNVSAKERDAAMAALATARADLDSARRRLALEWGPGIAKLDDGQRERLLDQLAQREAVLVRVEIPVELTAEPKSVALLPNGARAGSPEIDATVLGALPGADPRLQSRALLARSAGTPSLPVGRSLAARLPVGGAEAAGVTLPRAALLRSRGALWVFVRVDPASFERRKVEGGEAVEDGWFVTAGFAPGELAVTAGAADLLAAERPAEAPAAEDDED